MTTSGGGIAIKLLFIFDENSVRLTDFVGFLGNISG
jgi:hypothetical protein